MRYPDASVRDIVAVTQVHKGSKLTAPATKRMLRKYTTIYYLEPYSILYGTTIKSKYSRTQLEPESGMYRTNASWKARDKEHIKSKKKTT